MTLQQQGRRLVPEPTFLAASLSLLLASSLEKNTTRYGLQVLYQTLFLVISKIYSTCFLRTVVHFNYIYTRDFLVDC